jgi:hypothetical protein
MGTAEIKIIIKQLGEKKAPLLQVLLAVRMHYLLSITNKS